MVLGESSASFSVLLPLFIAVALGYGIGKIRILGFSIGGLAGTLLAAILTGLYGVETDENIKALAFALFIYSLGYVSGPQFFGSLGRRTLGQVHLAVFSTIMIFLTIWVLARVFDLDKGTAAGLLAGATTESASIGTASDALRHLGLSDEEVSQLQANIAVTYAVTYLFGLTLVVFMCSRIVPRLLGVRDLREAAVKLEQDLGTKRGLETGQFEFLREIVARVFRVEDGKGAGLRIEDLRARFGTSVTVQAVIRDGELVERTPELVLNAGDHLTLVGIPSAIVAAGAMLGSESTDPEPFSGLVGEVRDVVVTARDRVDNTVATLTEEIDVDSRRGAFALQISRMGRTIPLLPRTVVHEGDVVRLIGLPDAVDRLSKELGHTLEPSESVDYVFLALGIIAGMIVGHISVPIGGSPVSLGIGGGCLLSGLVFGWIQMHRPRIGNLPSATALHMRDFGLAIFIACVGLAAGPQALEVIRERGLVLPLFSILVVTVPLLSSMLYARFVIKMHPVLITGALAGLLTCTAALNASVSEADSEIPVLGYTVPYAIANVLLTLLGPVIVLTT